jgi:hypothetical protein
MSRQPSPETKLRNLKRELLQATVARNQYQHEAMVLRGQLNKSQAETGEWKRRFDQLLAKARSFDMPSEQHRGEQK